MARQEGGRASRHEGAFPRWLLRFALLLGCAALFLLGYAATGNQQSEASAGLGVSYPNNGLFWMSNDAPVPGWLFMGTNRCVGSSNIGAGYHADAFNRVLTSTQGMPSYPNGVRIDENCATSEDLPTYGLPYNLVFGDPDPLIDNFGVLGTWDFYAWWDDQPRSFCQTTQCLDWWDDNPSGPCPTSGNPDCAATIGGRNRTNPATPARCAYLGVAHPCGHRDVLQLNSNRNYSNPATWILTLVHESMHPLGFADCDVAVPSATANGACGGRALLDGGTALTAGDRDGLETIYAPTFVPCESNAASWLSDDEFWQRSLVRRLSQGPRLLQPHRAAGQQQG